MAGDWIKMEKDTPEKPELLALASLLGVSVGEVFLACFKLWRWADSQTVDGCAPRVTTASLDSLCGLPGFSDALLEVGWLQVRSGSLGLPNFARHMGQPAKARTLAAARMKRLRTPALPKCDAPSATKPSPEKRREEKKEEEPPNPPPGGARRKRPKALPPPIPPNLDTPEFRAAWGRWEQYRRERRKPVTPSTAARQLELLAGFGPREAVLSIDQSILRGWEGLFKPEDNLFGTNRNGTGNLGASSRVRAEEGKYDNVPEFTPPPAPDG
jgi:hypothetical protein